MIITNIPRRKLYEELQDYEDSMITFQEIITKEEIYNKTKKEFKEQIQTITNTYQNVIALLPIFFENKIFHKEEEFEQELAYHKKNKNETTKFIQTNKNLTKKFKELTNKLNKELEEQTTNKQREQEQEEQIQTTKYQTYNQAKELFNSLDQFNHHLTEILMMRRTRIK